MISKPALTNLFLTLTGPITMAEAANSLGAFSKGDRIACMDDVANATYHVKILSVSPASAYVRSVGNQASSFAPASSVRLSFADGNLLFRILRADGLVDELSIEEKVKLYSKGDGYFADGGDSRGVECRLLSANPAGHSEWTELQPLAEYEIRQLSQENSNNPRRIPSEALNLIRRTEMIDSLNAVIAALKATSSSEEEFNHLRATIDLHALRQDDVIMLWLSGAADPRQNSSYQVRIEFDRSTNQIVLWTDVEFVDHP
jgi:hypothetical protein